MCGEIDIAEINLKSFHEIVISKLSISSQFYLVFSSSRIYRVTSPQSLANDLIYYSFIIINKKNSAFQFFEDKMVLFISSVHVLAHMK